MMSLRTVKLVLSFTSDIPKLFVFLSKFNAIHKYNTNKTTIISIFQDLPDGANEKKKTASQQFTFYLKRVILEQIVETIW